MIEKQVSSFHHFPMARMVKRLFLNEWKVANVEEMLMAQSVPQGWKSQACLQHWNHLEILKSEVTSVPPQKC